MSRPRVNPFETGTAERLLYDRFRKARAAAVKAAYARDLAATEASAYDAAATKYAEAIAALGHADKLPDDVREGLQLRLPAPTEETTNA